MNRIYRIIWSRVRNTWMVVSELATGHGKSGGAQVSVHRRAVPAAKLTVPVVARSWPLTVAVLTALLAVPGPARAADLYWDANRTVPDLGSSGTWNLTNAFWDTAGGQMTNLGAHQLDIVDWTLGLDKLKSVASAGGRYALRDGGETPDTQDALFDCGAYSAAFAMRETAAGEKPTFGLTFYGTRGSLGIDRKGYTVTADPDLVPTNQIPGIKAGHPPGGPVAVPAVPLRPGSPP